MLNSPARVCFSAPKERVPRAWSGPADSAPLRAVAEAEEGAVIPASEAVAVLAVPAPRALPKVRLFTKYLRGRPGLQAGEESDPCGAGQETGLGADPMRVLSIKR
ncbi:hypothetical protein GCM10022206_43900 [Streptomyces chiangmaiensis]